jgi:hypothetical protein
LDFYRARLGAAGFWQPYAEAALGRSGLPVEPMASGFIGTYPTLVGSQHVVKLFGFFGDWRRSAETELAANAALRTDGLDLAPRIVASGSLFPERDDDWPFLITERLAGEAWRDADLTASQRGALARELGRRVRRVHGVRPTSSLRNGGLPDHRAAERHRRWGSLPPRLIGQIPQFIAGYRRGAVCLVHADLTEDHLFVDGRRLVGVIDWGDARVEDPFYELGALHLGAFAADRRLLGYFLAGYGWPIDDGFATRAMQAALMHEFDLFAGVADRTESSPSLAALAEELWTPLRS